LVNLVIADLGAGDRHDGGNSRRGQEQLLHSIISNGVMVRDTPPLPIERIAALLKLNQPSKREEARFPTQRLKAAASPSMLTPGHLEPTRLAHGVKPSER
jgi:hypothetical protein